jgi:ribosomal protein L11 methylase PrmA
VTTLDVRRETRALRRPHQASFRDPAGFIFTDDGVLYRQVNPVGRADYDGLMSSGLYEELIQAGDLVAHEEASSSLSPDGQASVVLRPTPVGFISYPYEWCFSELKDAALLTLRLQKAAVKRGLSLKDATAYNVAFEGGRPVWIDTLSFERLQPGKPWVAYRQFCKFFLAPLAAISFVDVGLLQLLRAHIDGLPLELTSRLLPATTRLRPGILTHIHLQAAAERRVTEGAPNLQRRHGQSISATASAGILDSLERTVKGLTWRPGKTTWGDYYDATNYTDSAFGHKREIVTAAIERVAPRSVWDLGANDGTFSRLASERGIPAVAFDVDPVAVEKNYRRVKERDERHLLPLLLDLTNPTARSGWAHEERDSFADRGPADLVLALALIHHLAIGNNLPLPRIAEFFARVARALVIEFVPKGDSQLQRMLATRDDIFDRYTQAEFESTFAEWFTIEQVIPVRDTERTIYLMRRREP